MKYTVSLVFVLLAQCVHSRYYPYADQDNGDFDLYDAGNNTGQYVDKFDPSKLGIDAVKQYSGYINDQDTDKHHFYWLFESRHKPATDPVILYLSGGLPGCGSLPSIFLETGPAYFKDDKPTTPIINPHSLNANATVLYMDAICNSGYSFCKTHDSNDEKQASVTLGALTNFFSHFPEYSKQDFYVVGRGVMGHFVPALAAKILDNHNAKTRVNLKGIVLGNVMFDPEKQFPQIGPMACGSGGVGKVLPDLQCAVLDDSMKTCVPKIHKCYDKADDASCEDALESCSGPWNRISATRHGMCNILHPEEEHGPPGYGYDGFAFQRETVKALGVPSEGEVYYNECFWPTFGLWGTFYMQPTYRHVASLIGRVRVLVEAGDYDWSCSWLGVEAATNALHWPGRASFVAAETRNLTVAGRGYGTVRSSSQAELAFARIFRAGFEAPRFEREGYQDLIRRFTSNAL